MALIVEDLWRVNYSIDTNSSIKSHRVKHLLADTFHFICIAHPYLAHGAVIRLEAVAGDKLAYVYF